MSLWDDFLNVLTASLKSPSISISVPLPAFNTNPPKEKPPSMGNFKYFSDKEIEGLDRELCAMLDVARARAGVPFIITSGKRTPEQNNSVIKGAVTDSAHLTGLAVDLQVVDDNSFYQMVEGLIVAGFNRFGFYYSQTENNVLKPIHIHVDIDETKPQRCIWTKNEQN